MPERKLTVFLVDDESIIRNGMKKLFDWESNGFTITGEAENGRDALPLILSLKPDIIITDLKMPFCDGITLASEIKKDLPSYRDGGPWFHSDCSLSTATQYP